MKQSILRLVPEKIKNHQDLYKRYLFVKGKQFDSFQLIRRRSDKTGSGN